jgi:hypothetical protein
LHQDSATREARLELWTNFSVDRIREMLATRNPK